MDTESVKNDIQQHVGKGNYHAAINIAISAMNEQRRENNQQGVDLFLGVIQDIVHIMYREFGS